MNLLKISFFLLLSTLYCHTLNAEIQRNYTFGTKIDIPSDWSKKVSEDHGDKIYDFYSPDQNLSIQIRLFALDEALGVDDVIDAYEKNILPVGTRRESLVDHTSVNGIPGKQGMYIVKHNNYELAVGVFYVKKVEKVYILSAIVPTNLLETRSPELMKITKTFVIEGFQNQEIGTNVVTNNSLSRGNAFLKTYSLSDDSLSNKLDTDIGSGVTPVGLNISDGELELMYLNQDLFNITAWAIDWYTDAETIKAGLTSKMKDEGYFPMGISSDDSKLYFLYVKGEMNALAWQLVESPQDLQQVAKNIEPYLKDSYLPLGITLHGDYYYVLLVQIEDIVFTNWDLQGYQDVNTMNQDIQLKIQEQKMPFGYLKRGGVMNVLYVGL